MQTVTVAASDVRTAVVRGDRVIMTGTGSNGHARVTFAADRLEMEATITVALVVGSVDVDVVGGEMVTTIDTAPVAA